MRKPLLYLFCLLLGLLYYRAALLAGEIPQTIMLDGNHRFAEGDDPCWAAAELDDSGWQTIMVPGSFQAQAITLPVGIGWYRLRFTMPEDLHLVRPAILLGRVGDADELFLNGVKIGGSGSIGENFIEASKVQRLYPIPAGLILEGRENIVAIRVMNTYLNGGLFDRGIAVGEYDHLLATKVGREKYVAVMEACFFTFFAMFFLTSLFFGLKGLRDREYTLFWLFISAYGLLFFLGSVTFYNTGHKSAFVQQLINALAALLPANLLLLLLHIYRKEPSRRLKVILTAFLLMSLANFVLPGYSWRSYLYLLWSISFVLSAAFLVYLAVRAYINRYYESGPVLVGIIGLVAGWVLESIGGIDLLQITGFFLWDYSVGFFMICVMYALTARYTRIRRELEEASTTIFHAHEDERKRLARELHDSIGPSLLAIKLELQMIETTAGEGVKDAFRKLVGAITAVIDEVRAISLDLRPSFLENVEIAEAITWHAANIQEKLGVKIAVEADGRINTGPKVRENLYRIYQEALNNAIKYSGANRVEVSLRLEARHLIMEVKDNGAGFDLAQAESKREGIGLYTIRERAGLLSGICRIKSARGQGTSIFIKVPIV